MNFIRVSNLINVIISHSFLGMRRGTTVFEQMMNLIIFTLANPHTHTVGLKYVTQETPPSQLTQLETGAVSVYSRFSLGAPFSCFAWSLLPTPGAVFDSEKGFYVAPRCYTSRWHFTEPGGFCVLATERRTSWIMQRFIIHAVAA